MRMSIVLMEDKSIMSMRVVYFAPTSSMYGDNIALLNFLNLFVSEGLVEPLIITSRKDLFTEKLDELGYRYIIHEFDSSLWPNTRGVRDCLLFFPRLIKYVLRPSLKSRYVDLTEEIREFLPDIIHSNNSCSLLGYRIAKKMHVPHLQHIREYGKLDMGRNYFFSKRNYIKRISRRNMDYVLCITKGVEDSFKSLFYKQTLINDEKWRVIYDGVFPSVKNNAAIYKDKENYFLYVGRLFPGKGLKELIQQFALFSKNDKNGTRLKIIGTGAPSYERYLYSWVKSQKIGDRVDFLGYKTNVYDYMKNAYALFVPSYFEGFGFITAEAMYNGCLVVGRNTGGTKEQFDNGLSLMGDEIALRCATDTEFSVCMSNIVNNGVGYYIPMIERAQRVVNELYTIERCADQVYDFYEYILNR